MNVQLRYLKSHDLTYSSTHARHNFSSGGRTTDRLRAVRTLRVHRCNLRKSCSPSRASESPDGLKIRPGRLNRSFSHTSGRQRSSPFCLMLVESRMSPTPASSLSSLLRTGRASERRKGVVPRRAHRKVSRSSFGGGAAAEAGGGGGLSER